MHLGVAACSYPTFSGRHQSTEESLKAGRIKTAAKVWAAARLLQLTGNGRKARTLVQGFKAFCVQNSFRWGLVAVLTCQDPMHLD